MTGIPELAEGPFGVIAYRVHRDGEPYEGGVSLRESASKAYVACEVCGLIPTEQLPGWTSDWHWLCREAMHHAEEQGHRVAVESWNGAVYGPPTSKDKEEHER